MERVGEWRVIEAADSEEDGGERKASSEAAPRGARASRVLIGAVAGVVLAFAGAAIWLTLPSGGATLDLAKGPAAALGGFGEPPIVAVDTTRAEALIVDVEGAVVDPGVHEVRAGGRVADAIAAAGGYSSEVDLTAAASALNLAERLVDGQKIHVPARGGVAPLPVGASNAPTGGTGPIDINHASQSELESLPGIGPVTAAKIIAARPFATIDELDSRNIVGPSTMAQIRDLITVTP